MALVDGGSFVLPYDYQLTAALAAQGIAVDVFASRTRYNGEFLAALRALPGVVVRDRAISRTVAPRWRGGLAYLGAAARALAPAPRLRRDQSPVQRLLAVRARPPRAAATTARLHRPQPGAARLSRAAPRADGVARGAGEKARLRQPLQPRRLHRPLRRALRRAFRGHRPRRGADPAGSCAGAVRGRRGPPEALVYWSTVKPYKGVELFAELARSERIHATGLRLEIHGAWDAIAHAAARRACSRSAFVVDDRYLDPAELLALLARNVVFVLPYRDASQSGALYALLHHGRLVVCADSGDLGDFMRRLGLEAMLLGERSADAVADALDRLRRDQPAIAAAFQAAQAASSWGAAAAVAIARVYAAP